MHYSTVLKNTVMHNIVHITKQTVMVQHKTIQYCTGQHSTIYSIVLFDLYTEYDLSHHTPQNVNYSAVLVILGRLQFIRLHIIYYTSQQCYTRLLYYRLHFTSMLYLVQIYWVTL